MRRSAFTLIETLAVIALMAILTAAVTVSLSGAVRAARIDDVAEQFATFDRTTREAARSFGRTPELRFELNRGTIRRTDGDRDATPLILGGGVRVSRVVLRDQIYRSGEVAVPFSTRGQTPSYAVLLTGAAGERWVGFSGLTGQSLVLTDEREAMQIFSTTGLDAR